MTNFYASLCHRDGPNRLERQRYQSWRPHQSDGVMITRRRYESYLNGSLDAFPPTPACLWNHTRRARMHTVDIDDRIQLHDYIFSRSFKWFIGMHLDGEHICRQYSGEVAARRRYWPVRSAGQIKNNEIQHLCQVEMSAGSEGGRSRWERVEDGGAGVWCAFIKAFLIITRLTFVGLSEGWVFL